MTKSDARETSRSETHGLLESIDPKVLEGFLEMRTWAMQPPPAGHMPLKYKHLFLVALNVLMDNEHGAFDHAREALKEGLKLGELEEMLVIGILCHGIVPFRKLGMRVLEHAREFQSHQS